MTIPFNLLKAGVQSGTLMFAGDIICQSVCAPVFTDLVFDKDRASRVGFVGLVLHGPYMYTVFTKIDVIFGSVPTLANVLKKVTTIQLTAFPLYLCLMFGLLGVLEGREFPDPFWQTLSIKYLEHTWQGVYFGPRRTWWHFVSFHRICV